MLICICGYIVSLCVTSWYSPSRLNKRKTYLMQTLLSRAIIFTLIHHHATDASQHRAEKKGNASCFAPPKQAPTNAGLKAGLDGASDPPFNTYMAASTRAFYLRHGRNTAGSSPSSSSPKHLQGSYPWMDGRNDLALIGRRFQID
jgi:hypothetical protein